MAFTTGTATDYHDLLDQLRLWLTGTVGWTQLRWNAPASLTDTAELWLRGPGAGPERRVNIGIRTGANTSKPAYGWEVRGSIAFDSGVAYNQQNGVSPGSWFNLWQNSIPFWFYANDRRFIVVAKVSSTYIPMYAGFFLPFALPSEYAFPLLIGTNYRSLQTFDFDNSGNRFFIDPGLDSCFFRRRTVADWRAIENNTNSDNDNSDPGPSNAEARMWPQSTTVTAVRASFTSWQTSGLAGLRPNALGESPLWQCHILDRDDNVMPGALDGVFATPGFNRATEQVITSSGRTFRLFQNIFRSTGRDFMAIEEI